MADIGKSADDRHKPASWGATAMIAAVAIILLGVIVLGLAQSLVG
jgi:hypothetical protein